VAARRRSTGPKEFSLWKIKIDPVNGCAVGKSEQIVKWERVRYYAEGMSATRDGRSLSVVKTDQFLNIYVGALSGNASRLENVQRLTLQHTEDTPETWTSDGSTLLLNSDRNGAVNLVKRNIRQQTDVRLFGTSDSNAVGGQFTPHGAWLLYWSSPNVGLSTTTMIRLIRVSVQGGNSDVVLEVPLSLAPQVQCPRRPGAFCVMSETKDNEIFFYELDPLHGKGKELARTEIRGGPHYYGWDISPDGFRLAVVDKSLRTIELRTGKTQDINVPKDWNLQSVSWSADGKGVFVTVYSPTAYLLGHVDLKSGTARILLQKENQWINHVVASPDGRHLAFKAQSWDSNVWLLESF
jgi:WD40 repeat protein